MKLIRVLVISFCIILIISQNVFALEEIFATGGNWMATGEEKAGVGIDTENLKPASSALYNLLLAVATIVAVIIGAILGVKYMMAGLDSKAQVKESLFPYLISCVVVFGSLGIWKLVVTILSEIK